MDSTILRAQAQMLSRELRWNLTSVAINGFGGNRVLPRTTRARVYRGLGVRVGRGAQIRAHCTIDGDPRHLSIGPETFINQECYFDAGAPITIGRRCGIGLGVMILTSVHTLGEDGHPSREPTYEPVTVGDRVGLFARVTVLPGVTIGECVSVAAGAVVTRDLEPWTLYAGVPARKVRSLRPEGSLAD